MADEHTDVLPQPRSDQVQTRPWSPVVLGALMATEGVAFAVLLGLDGSAPWRVVRVLVVIVVTEQHGEGHPLRGHQSPQNHR